MTITSLIILLITAAAAAVLLKLNSRLKSVQKELEGLKHLNADLEEKNSVLEAEVMISESLEKSLQESEERFRTMSMAAQDAMVMINNEGVISFWNRAATSIFGYSAHEAMDKKFFEITVPEHYHEKYLKEFRLFRESGRKGAAGGTVELEAVRRDGGTFPVEVSLSAMQLEENWQALCIVRDIGQRKEYEAELEAHRKNLEALVVERTKELEKVHKELIHKAFDAGRAQLSAIVLHNIGNAITPVSVNIQEIRKSGLKEISHYLKECYDDLAAHKNSISEYVTKDERGIRVARYTGELIDEFARKYAGLENIIDSMSAGIEYVAEILSLQGTYAPGRGEIKEWHDLNEIINDAIKIQEGSIVKRKISVEKKLASEPLNILIEKNKMMQVLVNLIKNSCEAIDACRQSKEHKIVASSRTEDDTIIAQISDTGCGIEADRRENVFEAGVSSKGTSGFGLYYCKSFIEENRGEILLNSQGKDKGTTFTIKFHLKEMSDR